LKTSTILFDLDGTLIDSTNCILAGFEHAFMVHDAEFPGKGAITKLIGYPLDEMFISLGVEPKFAASFVTSYKEKYRQIYLDGTTLLAGGAKALEVASDFATLGVVTTKTSEYSRILLEHLGVMKFFGALIGRDDVQNPKPHKEPILKALAALNAAQKNAYMIGDTKLDALAAKNAGITPLGVRCGYAKEPELKANFDHVFDTALDAINWLKSQI